MEFNEIEYDVSESYENCEMIARFMGLQEMEVWMQHEHEYSSNEVELVTVKEMGWGREGCPYGFDINYDEDLRLLFDVLQKIKTTNNPLNNASHTIELKIAYQSEIIIRENFGNDIIVIRRGNEKESIEESMIELESMIFDAIVSFVKWYNEMKDVKKTNTSA